MDGDIMAYVYSQKSPEPPDLYKILGVSKEATQKEIGSAYKQKREGLDRYAAESLDRAYEVLRDSKRRKEYDDELMFYQGHRKQINPFAPYGGAFNMGAFLVEKGLYYGFLVLLLIVGLYLGGLFIDGGGGLLLGFVIGMVLAGLAGAFLSKPLEEFKSKQYTKRRNEITAINRDVHEYNKELYERITGKEYDSYTSAQYEYEDRF